MGTYFNAELAEDSRWKSNTFHAKLAKNAKNAKKKSEYFSRRARRERRGKNFFFAFSASSA